MYIQLAVPDAHSSYKISLVKLKANMNMDTPPSVDIFS